MKGFGFSLAANTFLREDTDGYFLISHLPIKILRLNESLYRLLGHIQDGGELADFASRNPGLDAGNLLRVLLSLVAKGYLKLERIAEIEDFPLVSVIIPVKDQPEDLIECLQSLENLDYPGDRLEIIVVDDGSQKETSDIVDSPDVKIIRQGESQGPAACRNIGAENARGEILAFIDADCMAGEKWLKDIIPFFQTSKIGAVGGYVDGYYKDSLLDRYEQVSSSLNMGNRLLLEGKTESSFYVPTANMLVSREAFISVGGFKAGMHVGEDVDFCWRLRNSGYTLLYIPLGSVAHKHRNRLGRMLKRRGEYGTSEAILYRTHPDKKKTFFISVFAGLSFLAFTLAILLVNAWPVAPMLILFGLDLWCKSATLLKFNITLPFPQVISATLRSYLSFFYFAFFHLVRYYLILIFALGFLWHPLWVFGGLAIICTSIVDYYVKKPGLFYPVFLFFYLLEHLAYQVGVFRGCFKQKYFGSYILSFRHS
ncbi:MAG: mycofactocin biosynthesis glycosyltransferase MftF [Dehalococcoidales bacterium]|nr:mycofactocin biosynthesis glycosyltransferase MftF [Dehalococcoidales bacterium]